MRIIGLLLVVGTLAGCDAGLEAEALAPEFAAPVDSLTIVVTDEVTGAADGRDEFRRALRDGGEVRISREELLLQFPSSLVRYWQRSVRSEEPDASLALLASVELADRAGWTFDLGTSDEGALRYIFVRANATTAVDPDADSQLHTFLDRLDGEPEARLTEAHRRRNGAVAISTLRTIIVVSEQYRLRNGHYPDTLGVLVEKGYLGDRLQRGQDAGFMFTHTRSNGGYSVEATPDPNAIAAYSYFVDQSGVIRYETHGRATAESPVIQ